MKRALTLALALLALVPAGPALAAALLAVTVTGAVTAQTSPILQTQPRTAFPTNMLIQGNFTYGSGGTTADAWVQTSCDGGSTWNDVANFHFLLANARFIYNVSSLTPKTTQVTPTDGTLASNTSNDGVLCTLWRVKYTTTGTYAGGTKLEIDIEGPALTAQ